jgi:chromosome segregation ATPase
MGRITCPLIVVAIAMTPAAGGAQTVADRPTTDPLVVEMRLLRHAVDRLTVLTVKSHLAVSRLVAQQQRVAREQVAVDRAEEAIDAADRDQERKRATLARVSRQLDNVVEEPRSELRREVEGLRADLDDRDRQIERLRIRLSRAEQSLRNEQQAYAQVEAALAALERETQRPSP